MRTRQLERKLLWGVVAMFVMPTALTEGTLIVLYRRGVFPDAWGLLLTVLIGLAAMMAYLSWIAYAIGRPLIHSMRMIQDGTELMTTVNPDHRIEVRTGDEREALAEDINQLADHLRDAKGGLESRVAEATRALRAERETLAAILDGLADGVVVATLDGRITLANPVAQAVLDSGGPLVGRSVFDLVDQSRVARSLDELRNGSRSAQRFAITIANGDELHAAMTPLLDVDGRLTGVTLALRDPRLPAHRIDEDPAASRSPGPLRFAGGGIASGMARHTPGPARPERYDFSLFNEMERNVAAVQRDRRLDELTFMSMCCCRDHCQRTCTPRPSVASTLGVQLSARAGDEMKAIYITEPGGPEKLIFGDRPDPEAGAGEVIVRVRATALNHADLSIRAGRSPTGGLPRILGLDIAGDVASLGPGVTGWGAGDRVVVENRVKCGTCTPCALGRDEFCERQRRLGGELDGGHAQHCKVPAVNLQRIPDGMTFEEAATLPLAGHTAWHCLIERVQLQPWEDVLIQAVGSGVGSSGLLIAKGIGARVIATAGSDWKLERAKALGADDVINYTTTPKFSQRVKELTNGRGVDVVFDCVGAAVWDESLNSLKPGGRLVITGTTSGSQIPFNLSLMQGRPLTLMGSGARSRRSFAAMMHMVAYGGLRGVVGRTFDLEEAAKAHEVMAGRDFFGKLVLRVP